jgi:ABC-type antimicrobial peptide transport system permease subunit
MFKARTSRTFLTILGMSVGIGAILFLVSLGYGLQNTLLQKITTSDSLLTLDVVKDRSSVSGLNGEIIQKIKEISGVDNVSPAYQLDSQGKMENLTTDLSVTVTDPFYLKLGGVKTANGKLLNDEEIEGVIVSSSVAQIFGKSGEEILGKNLSFTFFLPESENGEEKNKNVREKYEPKKPFKIIGVLESDDSIVYINSKALSAIKNPDFSQLKVRCRESKIMPEVQKRIVQMGFSVSSLSETVDQANKVFRVVKIILMLFGIIALVVSAIGMFNTMTITLLERTEEIGIMKSIGASDLMISLMFIMEATIMGFLGGLMGIIIGWLEGEVFNFMVNLIATHFGGERVDLFFSPLWFIANIIIFSAVVGFLTGVIPARRASQIDPLDALRYK